MVDPTSEVKMESALLQLEQSVQKADGQLNMIAWKIDAYEKDADETQDNEVSVLRLLDSVNQVTKDYQNLRKEISEVQQLQKQLSNSLKNHISQVQGHFNILRNKITDYRPPSQG